MTKTSSARAGSAKTGSSKTGSGKTGSSKTGSTRARATRAATAAIKPAAKATAAKATAAKATAAKATVAKPEGQDVQVGFLADFVGFHLRLAQDASYRAFARHRDKDLIKPGRFPALAIIHLNPGISQSALGRAIARDKSTVSPLIKDLQKNGFISRKPSAYDRRSVTLSLTKKGERTLDRLHARAKEHETELDRIVGASKPRLMSLLGKIIEGMAV